VSHVDTGPRINQLRECNREFCLGLSTEAKNEPQGKSLRREWESTERSLLSFLT